jgi:type IV pilus assembly protein PilE
MANKQGGSMRVVRGFTLIEVMIVAAIIGILAAIGYPSYQNHLRKGARASAQTAMMQIADRQSQHLLDARNYAVGATALTTLNVTVPAEVTVKYTVTVVAADGTDTPSTPPTYTIRATPVTGGAQVQDGELTLTHTGAKTRAGNPGW